MSRSVTQRSCAEASSQATNASHSAKELREHTKTTTRPRTRSLPALISVESPPVAPSGSLFSRSSENRHWTTRDQRGNFSQHLWAWALDHDSSAYFHGSISLHPQGAGPGELVELGKSVSCILSDASAGVPPKRIVIRLFKSHQYDERSHQENVRRGKDVRNSQATLPYRMVIRSGSGWVPARQYFDQHYFAHRARSRKGEGSAAKHAVSPSSTANGQRAGRFTSTSGTTGAWTAQLSSLAANTSAASPTNARLPGRESSTSHHSVPSVDRSNARAPRQVSLPTRSSGPFDGRRTANRHSTHELSHLSLNMIAHPGQFGPCSPEKVVVNISPLFRPFLRLPQELQDEILFQATGHTRVINLTQALSPHPSSPPPITVSKLFQLSKSINHYMVPHIFGSTNFHFGSTGFTKFLWQLGPLNRAALRHLTFHFGKASLLHCIRWMAPDPVWEIFEPPVSTNPPTLMYFWRCQLQELLKELNLSTLTIDVKDVPLVDVPMLLRIMGCAMGSVERLRIVGSDAGPDESTECLANNLCTHTPDLQCHTWRQLSLQYHKDYRYQRWHMKQILTLRDVDLCPILNTWMNKNVDFFDS